jgi:hypothetical protein
MKALMKALAALANALFGKLSLCATSGGLAGVVAGFFFSMVLLHLTATGTGLSALALLQTGLGLGLVGWVILLIVVGMWLRYGVKETSLPAFVNAILTSVLTVFANAVVRLPALATLIGLLVGILVGSLLCWLCRRWNMRRPRASHG